MANTVENENSLWVTNFLREGSRQRKSYSNASMCYFLRRRKDDSEGRAETQGEEPRAKENSLWSSFTMDWMFGSLQNPYLEALIPREAVFDSGR